MKLLREEELIWSPIVANNRMNRKRKASGVNSYERDLKFNPEKYLDEAIGKVAAVRWLDLCCGEGNALLQYAGKLEKRDMQDRYFLEGIDLVDQFGDMAPNITCLRMKVLPLSVWVPADRYHLVTCVHGLHYVGDKLEVIRNALQAIEEGGIFIANLDIANIRIEGDATGLFVKRLFAAHKIDYNIRQKIIKCDGPRDLSIPLSYLGPDDAAGPNYTGQEVVDSYYARG